MSMTKIMVALFQDGHRFHGNQIYLFGNMFYLKADTLGIPKLKTYKFYVVILIIYSDHVYKYHIMQMKLLLE